MAMVETRPAEAGGTDLKGLPKQLHPIANRYKRSGITNDPNRTRDPQDILRLIGQVITVSLETVSLVNSLPGLGSAGA